MSQDKRVEEHGHSHQDGPCRCQGKCPGCPRRRQPAEPVENPSK